MRPRRPSQSQGGNYVPKSVMMVMSDPVPGMEDEYNEWYDRHLPEVVSVPGVAAAQRFIAAPGLNGQLPPQRYMVVYEFDTDDVEAGLEAIRQARSRLMADLPAAFDASSTASYAYQALGERAEAETPG
jgi:hypothetical protein